MIVVWINVYHHNFEKCHVTIVLGGVIRLSDCFMINIDTSTIYGRINNEMYSVYFA
jgi:hypothetical protein